MTPRMARAMQRDAGADQAARGWLGDPLKLPFARILQEVRGIRLSEAYRRLVQAGAAALTGGQQEAVYLEAVHGLDAHDLGVLVRSFQQLVVDMDDRPFMDLLGPLYMEIGHKFDKQGGGEFFTPHSVSLLLARMQVGPDIFTPGRILMCNEPTAGTGGMVLAFTQALVEAGVNPLHARWVIQDISARSCWGAFINATLWGIPAQVVCGDTLRMEARWIWTNRFWPLAQPWPTEAELAERAQAAIQEEWRIDAMRKFLAGLGAA